MISYVASRVRWSTFYILWNHFLAESSFILLFRSLVRKYDGRGDRKQRITEDRQICMLEWVYYYLLGWEPPTTPFCYRLYSSPHLVCVHGPLVFFEALFFLFNIYFDVWDAIGVICKEYHHYGNDCKAWVDEPFI